MQINNINNIIDYKYELFTKYHKHLNMFVPVKYQTVKFHKTTYSLVLNALNILLVSVL